jgi:amylosucrase
VLRLDAAPFLWKRMGTDCQNQPEAHLLLQAFRALARLAVPGLVLEAEAIVGPDMLVQYLGGHDRYRPECDLAYDNQLMVMLWSTLATRDARLAEHALARRRPGDAPSGGMIA